MAEIKPDFGCCFTTCQIAFKKSSIFSPNFHFAIYVFVFLETRKPNPNTFVVAALSAELFKSNKSAESKVNNIRVVIVWRIYQKKIGK